MNIFMISSDPKQSAIWLVDKHIVKMATESAQLLSTAHRILDGTPYNGKSKTGRNVKRWHLHDDRENILYLACHINHPSSIWTRTSVQNYLWLVEHFYAILDEYTYRYGKKHKCSELAYTLQSPPKNLTKYEKTPLLCAMDSKYIISTDPVVNYRNYYKTGKNHLFAWKNRQPPEWIIQ
jgi:hypothetical protein